MMSLMEVSWLYLFDLMYLLHECYNTELKKSLFYWDRRGWFTSNSPISLTHAAQCEGALIVHFVVSKLTKLIKKKIKKFPPIIFDYCKFFIFDAKCHFSVFIWCDVGRCFEVFWAKKLNRITSAINWWMDALKIIYTVDLHCFACFALFR